MSISNKVMDEFNREMERIWRQQWVTEGRSLADYKSGIDDQDSPVWHWRRAKGQASIAAERAAWLKDHLGNPLPEHECGMTDAAHAEYVRWYSKNYSESIAAQDALLERIRLDLKKKKRKRRAVA